MCHRVSPGRSANMRERKLGPGGFVYSADLCTAVTRLKAYRDSRPTKPKTGKTAAGCCRFFATNWRL